MVRRCGPVREEWHVGGPDKGKPYRVPSQPDSDVWIMVQMEVPSRHLRGLQNLDARLCEAGTGHREVHDGGRSRWREDRCRYR